ncbi:SpoIIE family protein phosphatase [Nonomuraea sp. MCN248]|uniref:SpoIIE family protein phosphatase n=1 Tax=Nonomuraea corallina TaxID=2989783 RepID=A0ABT4S8M6_9ACTN|nr:SpoIIE family protein phosphatase [Nonomuraea corallina]MDA0633531.1 SpoIIE family protein phosphatase [Nonomuraea corallina]
MRREPQAAAGPGRDARHLHGLLLDAVDASGAHIGALYLLGEDGQVLFMEAEHGFPAAIARAWSRVRLSGPVPVAVAVRERRLVWLADQEDLARSFPGAALALPYHFALAAAPVHTGDADWGGLLLAWPSGQAELTEEQRRVIEETCREMGTVLREAALIGQPVQARARPRVVSRARGRHLDPDAGLAALDCLNGLPEGYLALDLEGRITFLTAPAAELLGESPSRLLGERPWEVLPWLKTPQYEDRYRAAVISQEPASFTARRPGGQQWLAFQLYPAPLGLSVRITPSTMARDPGHLMPDPMPPGGVTADATTLYGMLQLATTLSQAATVQEVVDQVADHVLPFFNAQSLSIVTMESGRMILLGSHGTVQASIEQFNEWSMSEPDAPSAPGAPAGPVFYATPRELREIYPPSADDGIAACAVLPLNTPVRTLGTLVIGYERPHHFTADERATLTSLAGLVAQALERATLYDTKHQLAQSLQASLLPHRLPRVDGLEMASRYVTATRGMDIGGDFYDLIRLGDTCAAAVIGDVQGHDPTAAALMGQVRTAIHAYAASGADPGQVLTHANRLLIDLTPNRFTSCLYVNLDLSRELLDVASAGHLPALLHHDGDVRLIEPPPGLLLGIDPDAAYEAARMALPPGGMLVLYTDGLVEAPGVTLDDGIEDLCRRLGRFARRPLQEIADALLEQAQSAGQRDDDIALLLLRSAG